MGVTDFLKSWLEICNNDRKRYSILDIDKLNILFNEQEQTISFEPTVIESIAFKEESIRQLFMCELARIVNDPINFTFTEWYYSRLQEGNDFLSLSQEKDGNIMQTTKTEQEVLKHVRNSFWYLKNK